MTLVVALQGDDGVTIAADSRGTFGGPGGPMASNDTMKKLYIVSRHVGVLIYGANELGMKILDDFCREVATQKLDGVSDVMERLRAFCQQRYSSWFSAFPLDKRPPLGFIVAGYDPDEGTWHTARIFSIFSALDFAPQLHAYGFACGGIPFFATYILNRVYAKDMRTNTLAKLAVYVISETAAQDGRVGGPIKVALIDPTGSRELTIEEVNKIIKDNEAKSEQLKAMFSS